MFAADVVERVGLIAAPPVRDQHARVVRRDHLRPCVMPVAAPALIDRRRGGRTRQPRGGLAPHTPPGGIGVHHGGRRPRTPPRRIRAARRPAARRRASWVRAPWVRCTPVKRRKPWARCAPGAHASRAAPGPPPAAAPPGGGLSPPRGPAPRPDAAHAPLAAPRAPPDPHAGWVTCGRGRAGRSVRYAPSTRASASGPPHVGHASGGHLHVDRVACGASGGGAARSRQGPAPGCRQGASVRRPARRWNKGRPAASRHVSAGRSPRATRRSGVATRPPRPAAPHDSRQEGLWAHSWAALSTLRRRAARQAANQ